MKYFLLISYFLLTSSAFAVNVGIGTTAPAYLLDIAGNIRSQASVIATSDTSTASTYPFISVRRGRGAVNVPTYALSSDGIGAFGFADDVDGANSAFIYGYATENHSGTNKGTAIQIYTTPTGSTVSAARLTVLDSGNVGIGTTAPAYKFQVGTGGESNNIVSQIGNTAIGDADFGTAGAGIGLWATGTNLGFNNYTGSILFQTGNPMTTKMTILTGGNVGIGTTGPSTKLQVTGGDIRIDGDDKSLYFDDTNNGSTYRYRFHSNADILYLHPYSGAFAGSPAAVDWEYHSDGTAWKNGGGSWSNGSDRRLKESISPIDNGLEKVCQLNPVNFSWRNPEQHGGKKVDGGFIAQEMQKVFPEFVVKGKAEGADKALVDSDETILGINLPFKFDAYLVSAIKELKAIFEGHDREIASLKADSAGKDQRIDRLEQLQQENTAVKTYLCGKDPAASFCH